MPARYNSGFAWAGQGGRWGHSIAGIVRVVCWFFEADSKEMNG
jgi:hypothetical protein